MLAFCMGILALLPAFPAVRVSDKIYEDLQGNMACFKRFNGTHEVGCTSDYGGNVGVLYIPEDVNDTKWALENGPHSPYILALEPLLFIREVLMIAKQSKNVKGIVVFNTASQHLPSDFSPASTCPSHAYGLYNSSGDSQYSDVCAAEPWNPVGNSLLFESFDFPIFLLQDDKSVNATIDCFNKFNKGKNGEDVNWPLCAVQLHSNMFGTTSSEVCLRRTRSSQSNGLININYCDAIHDYNIIGSINPMVGELPEASVIVIAARADAASMFDNNSPGADSAVSGLVTLLAVSEALSKLRDDFIEANKNVLFILFEGETWDYLGSISATFDMEYGRFPFSPNDEDPSRVSTFNFSHIEHFIELSQVGIQVDSGETMLFLHTDPASNSDSSTQEANNILREALVSAGKLSEVNVDTSTSPYPLPPASFQNFLKYANISGAVLTDHSKQFKNKFYQSYLDNHDNVQFSSTIDGINEDDKLHIHLNNIASTVSSAVYSLATGRSAKITTNETLVGEMLFCYLRNVNCTLFREHASLLLSSIPGYFQPVPAKMYSSVWRGEDILTNITLFMMGHFLGEEISENVHECWSNSTAAVQKFFINTMGENGTCFTSTARKLSAESPAFRIPDYNFSSGQYPSWTESGWSFTSARLFLKPAPSEEIGLVIGGVLFVVLTAILSYWANAKSSTLFVTAPAPAQC